MKIIVFFFSLAFFFGCKPVGSEMKNSKTVIIDKKNDSNLIKKDVLMKVEIDTILAETIEELILGLRNNRVIFIVEGSYILQDTIHYYANANEKNYVRPNKNGYYGNNGKLWIGHFKNLKIIGQGRVKIESNNRKVAPLSLAYSTNIEIKNLYIGHTKERLSSCEEGVFSSFRNNGILLSDCIFDGSGIYGVDVIQSRNISLVDCSIQNCKQHIGIISKSKQITFNRCNFTNNGCFPGFSIQRNSDSIFFSDCQFIGNFSSEINEQDGEDVMFSTDSKTIQLETCLFKDNRYIELLGLPHSDIVNCNMLDSIKISN